MSPSGQKAGLARGPQVRSRRACVRRAIKAGTVDLVALMRVLTNALELRADARLSSLTISRRRKLADALGKEITRP
jgi:hypothetical protein